MYQISNFTDNDDVKIISRLGAFQVIEYQGISASLRHRQSQPFTAPR